MWENVCPNCGWYEFSTLVGDVCPKCGSKVLSYSDDEPAPEQQKDEWE